MHDDDDDFDFPPAYPPPPSVAVSDDDFLNGTISEPTADDDFLNGTIPTPPVSPTIQGGRVGMGGQRPGLLQRSKSARAVLQGADEREREMKKAKESDGNNNINNSVIAEVRGLQLGDDSDDSRSSPVAPIDEIDAIDAAAPPPPEVPGNPMRTKAKTHTGHGAKEGSNNDNNNKGGKKKRKRRSTLQKSSSARAVLQSSSHASSSSLRLPPPPSSACRSRAVSTGGSVASAGSASSAPGSPRVRKGGGGGGGGGRRGSNNKGGTNKASRRPSCASSSAKARKRSVRPNYSRDEILTSLPEEVTAQFQQVCWVRWEGKTYVPALILSPFDVSKGEAVERWMDQFHDYATWRLKRAASTGGLGSGGGVAVGGGRRSPPSSSVSSSGDVPSSFKFRTLVYFYECGPTEIGTAFALVQTSAVVEYRVGIKRGYHRPRDILRTMERGGILSRHKERQMEGIRRILIDAPLAREERGGEMFFPHLIGRNLEEEAGRAAKPGTVAGVPPPSDDEGEGGGGGDDASSAEGGGSPSPATVSVATLEAAKAAEEAMRLEDAAKNNGGTDNNNHFEFPKKKKQRKKQRRSLAGSPMSLPSEPAASLSPTPASKASSDHYACSHVGQDHLAQDHLVDLPPFPIEILWPRAGEWWGLDRWTRVLSLEYDAGGAGREGGRGECRADWGSCVGWTSVLTSWRRKVVGADEADGSASALLPLPSEGLKKGRAVVPAVPTDALTPDCTPVEAPPFPVEIFWPDQEDWIMFDPDKTKFYFWDGGSGGPCRVEYTVGKKWRGRKFTTEWRELKKREKRPAAVTNIPKPPVPEYIHSRNQRSLEICSGVGAMSRSFDMQGFETTRHDWDESKGADSRLSLQHYRRRLREGTLPDSLEPPFQVIWAAPDCRTWSRAAAGFYRTKQNIDGFPDRNSYAEAQEAKRDIEALVEILAHYQKVDPRVLLCIENPDGYLKDHPVSERFKTELGLTMVQVSYCKFRPESTDGSSTATPKKDTLIWTNSKRIIHALDGDVFYCRNDCTGLVRGGNRHQELVQDRNDRYAAYPKDFCTFMAMLLGADATALHRRRGNA